jgi:hypothetical protein
LRTLVAAVCDSKVASLVPSSEVFGSGSKIGKRISSLQKYQYMMGMPYFHEVVTVAKGANDATPEQHLKLVTDIETKIKADVKSKGVGQMTQVYQLSLAPHVTLIGVGMPTIEGYLNTIDQKSVTQRDIFTRG